MAADVGTILPDDFLVKVDRASMAHGLEVRPPLLDHELMELAARIPADCKVRGGETKWVLKQAFGDQLPDCAVSRPKHGFELPIDAWLRGPLAETFEAAVLAPQAQRPRFRGPGRGPQLAAAHCSGAGRHGGVLWSLLVLARWAERHLGAPVPSSQVGVTA